MGPLLSVEERDALLSELRSEQRFFLEEQVKRGKKTAFANELAKKKGIYFHEGLTEEQAAELLKDWMLDDYVDAGAGYRTREPLLKCECGRVLRHQYIVKHSQTGERRMFGSEHFAEHTGIPSDIVKAVLEGMRGVDYELDELLIKIRDNWTAAEAVPLIPHDLELPSEIGEQMKLGLPLLDKQVRKISRLIDEKERAARLHRLNEKAPVSRGVEEELAPMDEGFAQLDLFDQWNEANPAVPDLNRTAEDKRLRLTDPIKQAIQVYLADGVHSARMICELLIRDHQASQARYITEKPRIYMEVCSYIETLSVQVTRADEIDRFYDIV